MVSELLNKAIRYHEQGNLPAAEAIYQQIMSSEADHAEAFHQLGVLVHQAGKHEMAIVFIKRAIELNPKNAHYYNNMGELYRILGRPQEAYHAYEQALVQDASFARVYHNLGILLEQQGGVDKAIEYYQKAIELDPILAEAYNNLGNIWFHQENVDKAIVYYQKALELNSTYTAHNNLSNALREVGDYQQAIYHAEQAIVLNPTSATIHDNLGNAFMELGKVGTAIEKYQHAIFLDPFHAYAHYNLSLALLCLGQYEQGFTEYEWRWKIRTFAERTYSQPRWDGTDIYRKTILVHDEQGFGDCLQFIRYIPLLANYGCRIIVECKKPLFRLLSTMKAIDQIVFSDDALPNFDVYVPLGSLPHLLKTSLQTVPHQTPYLFLGDLVSIEIPLEPASFKVGIVWASHSKIGKKKSCDLKDILSWFELPNIQFYSLQLDLNETEKGLLEKQSKVIDLSDQLNDFADTASAIQQLDLVISIDTACVHLAGALGKPVWVMLPYAAERWLKGRADSPWYPTARLFQQSEFGDWKEVCQEIKQALFERAMDRPGGSRKWDESNDADGFVSLLEKSNEYFNWGNVAVEQKNYPVAMAHYQKALLLDPNNAKVCTNLGVIKQQVGEFEEAVPLYQKALTLDPTLAEAHFNLGILLQEKEQFEQAIRHFKKAIDIAPSDPETYNNLGNVFYNQGHLEEAKIYYQKALSIKADYPNAHNNLGAVLEKQKSIDSAEACYKKAIELDPSYADAHVNHSLLLLLKGDYLEGFKQYEWRWKVPSMAPKIFEKPRWNGEILAGKRLLITMEQGVGDMVQFLRFLPIVKRYGCQIIVESVSPLSRLLEGLPSVDDLREVGQALPEFDYHIPLMSLPHILKTTFQTIPVTTPYLTSPVSVPTLETESSLKVGVIWASRSKGRKKGIHYSCSLTDFSKLWEVSEIAFYSFQKDLTSFEIEALQTQNNVVDLSEQLQDFADTAGFMAQMDLIVAVDTAGAHLAGALGKPVWVLLPYFSVWFWHQAGDRSRWYPTARLFRQKTIGNWSEAIQDITAALKRWKVRQIKECHKLS